MSINRLPPVGRIRAVHLPEGGPRVPKSLTIEYSDRSNGSKWTNSRFPSSTRCTSSLCYRERRTTSATKSPSRHRRLRKTDAPADCDRVWFPGSIVRGRILPRHHLRAGAKSNIGMIHAFGRADQEGSSPARIPSALPSRCLRKSSAAVLHASL